MKIVACLQGRLVEEYYSDEGVCLEAVELQLGGPVVALHRPVAYLAGLGEWNRDSGGEGWEV